MRSYISVCSPMARATSAPVSASPTRVFQRMVSLSWSPSVSSSGPKACGEGDAAQHLEGVVGRREVRLDVLDDAAHRLERRAVVLQHRGHRGLDGQVAEVATPGDARRRADRGRRRARRLPADRRATAARAGRGRPWRAAAGRRPRRCAPAARGRPSGSTRWATAPPARAPARCRRPTRLQKDAGLRMLAPRSDPSAERDHAAGHRGGRAAAAAARRARGVVGVAGRAEDGVEGLRAGAELGRVRLADDDRAGAAQAGDHQRVRGRDVVAVDRRAVGRPHARGVLEVLDRDRQAVQRPGRLVAPRARRRPPRPRAAPSSASRVTIALSSGLTASMRARCASMTSTQLTSRPRIAAASSVALLRHSSSLIAGILARGAVRHSGSACIGRRGTLGERASSAASSARVPTPSLR